MWQATNPVHTFTFPSLLYRFYEERKSLCLVVARQYQELSPEILFHLVWLKSVQFEPFVCFWSFSYFSQNLLFSHTDTQTQTHTVDTDTDKQTDRLTDTQTDRQTHHFFFTNINAFARTHTYTRTDVCVYGWVGGGCVCERKIHCITCESQLKYLDCQQKFRWSVVCCGRILFSVNHLVKQSIHKICLF